MQKQEPMTRQRSCMGVPASLILAQTRPSAIAKQTRKALARSNHSINPKGVSCPSCPPPTSLGVFYYSTPTTKCKVLVIGKLTSTRIAPLFRHPVLALSSLLHSFLCWEPTLQLIGSKSKATMSYDRVTRFAAASLATMVKIF